MKTVKELIEVSTPFLSSKRGIAGTDARREVELLLGKILGCDRITVYLNFDRPLQDTELEIFRDFLSRRSRNEPLHWILGSIQFCGHHYLTPKNVFVPRPETEEWVDWLLQLPADLFPAQTEPEHILEIGTGTGVILCSLLTKWQKSLGVGMDVSNDAILATKANAELLNVSNRMKLIHSKAGQFQLHHDEVLFDVIVSNPPYIPISDESSLSNDVQKEPKSALYGGEDGLDAYRTFAIHLPKWLKSGGVYFFEIGVHQAESVKNLLKSFSKQQIIRNDLSGIPRVIAGIMK